MTRSMYVQSVSTPHTAHGGTVQASPCPPPRPVPKKTHQGNHTGKRTKEKKRPSVPYSSSADAMNGGVGRNNWCSFLASPSFPVPSAPTSASLSSSRSPLSRSSPSDASLPALSSTSAVGTILPTSNVRSPRRSGQRQGSGLGAGPPRGNTRCRKARGQTAWLLKHQEARLAVLPAEDGALPYGPVPALDESSFDGPVLVVPVSHADEGSPP